MHRAVEAGDFRACQVALTEVEARCSEAGHGELVVFAWMFAKFSSGMARREELVGDERRRIWDANADLDARLIADWGAWLYERNGAKLLRLVYADD